MGYGNIGIEKIYWSITEVSELTGVAPHMLRAWETAFPMLKPKKNRAGNRAYRKRDIECIEQIRQLVLVEKFTYEGARRKMLAARVVEHSSKTAEIERVSDEATIARHSDVPFPAATGEPTRKPDPEVLKGLRAELQRTLAMLKG